VSGDEFQVWHVAVRAEYEPNVAAAQVLDPRGVTTVVLWGTPEGDEGGDVTLNINLHTNVHVDDREAMGEALALYLEAVVTTLRGEQDEDALAEDALAEAAERAGLAERVTGTQAGWLPGPYKPDAE
jgi:hypothetical protein